MEEETGDLLEDSWFFGNLLHTKPRSISRCYSDIASSSCPPLHTHSQPDPLKSTLEHVVKIEQKKSSFSSRKQPPSAPLSLTRTPSLPTSIETQYSNSLMKKSSPSPNLMSSVVGVDKEDSMVKKDRKSSSFNSRKQPPVAPPRLTRIPSLPTLTETKSYVTKKATPNSNLTQTSSKSTSVDVSYQEDDEEESDQESEFTLGRLIRQASMNYSQTSNPTQQSTKTATVNVQKKPEADQKNLRDMRKMERNRSKSTKSRSGTVAPAIPGGLVDKTSSEDMKAHLKFWARAVASNVRQECS
uniref:uncharacterized protein LOC122598534 n=1 Tax=Erigeron canadensis TaxID=72917 RepID=UPI001CB97961|nr:uncharacterized protein LOC122598534 [Erigeron canadensis]